MDLRRDHASRRRPGRCAGEHLRRRQGGPGRHLHAEPPRMDRLVRGHRLHRSGVGLPQRMVDRGGGRLRHRGLRPLRAHRRSRTDRARPPGRPLEEHPHGRGPGRRDRAAADRCPPLRRGRHAGRGHARRRGGAGRRRHHPLHVGHDRVPQGCRVDPPGRDPGADGVLGRCHHPDGSTGQEPARRGWTPAELHPHRAPLPCDRMRSGDALVLRDEDEAGDDAPLGPRDGAAPHRGRTGDRLRRRAHPELGPAREPGVLQVRHLVAGHDRRWWCPGPGEAGRPRRARVLPGPAQHRLRDDRDQRFRPGQQRRRLRDPPDLDRSGPDHHLGHRDP